MLFHEIYGAYFMTVAKILQEAGSAPVTEKRILEIIAENAFAESMLVIPEKLKNGEWPLLQPVKDDAAGGQDRFRSVLLKAPSRPLTLLEKAWLKTILEDPRIQLFLYREEDREAADRLKEWLSGVSPLYDRDSLVYFDRYADGDDYIDPEYLLHFHTVLQAIHGQQLIFLRYKGRSKNKRSGLYYPYGIEYSSKDDKFRVLCRSMNGIRYTINVSRIRDCEIRRKAEAEETIQPKIRKSHVDLRLTDERNALQRAMIHFSDLQKETERIDEKHYRIRLYYYKDDETELLIRILSFGPMLEVLAPERFIRLITERIDRQLELSGPAPAQAATAQPQTRAPVPAPDRPPAPNKK